MNANPYLQHRIFYDYDFRVSGKVGKVVPRGGRWTLIIGALLLLIFTAGPVVVGFICVESPFRFVFVGAGIPIAIFTFTIFFWVMRYQFRLPSPWIVDLKRGELTIVGAQPTNLFSDEFDESREKVPLDAVEEIRARHVRMPESEGMRSYYKVYTIIQDKRSALESKDLGFFAHVTTAVRLGEQTAELLHIPFDRDDDAHDEHPPALNIPGGTDVK